MPNGAKPAFFEKVLINFFKSYDEFEDEICNIGDPFGLQEAKDVIEERGLHQPCYNSQNPLSY